MIAHYHAWVHADPANYTRGRRLDFTLPNRLFRGFGLCPFRGRVYVPPAAGIPAKSARTMSRAVRPLGLAQARLMGGFYKVPFSNLITEVLVKSEYNPFVDAMKSNAKRLQLAAWYMLMEGAERALNEVGDIVDKAWDGKNWHGDDNQFGEILATMTTITVAGKRIIPPDFIEKQHQQLLESIERLHSVCITCKNGKTCRCKDILRQKSRIAQCVH